MTNMTSNKNLTVICDNAANMKRAFTVCFPKEEDGDVTDDDNLDDAELWEDLSRGKWETGPDAHQRKP